MLEDAGSRTRSRSALEDELELLGAPLELRSASVPVYVPPNQVRRLPGGVMLSATAAWLGLVFGLCYVALPALFSVLGWNAGLLGALPLSALSFGGASLVTVVGASVLRPGIRLGVRASRDPVLSATAGGLLTWGLVHNTADVLRPFWSMGGTELATFLGANVLEMFLLGALLASFTRSRLLAFGLGGAFQFLALGLFVFLAGLLAAL